MLHTPGDDPISFIGRDLLQSLDGINGGSPSRTPNLQQHPQQQHPHQFAQPHPQYHPHQYQRGIILREDGPAFEDDQHQHEFDFERSGGYGRSTSDEHPSSFSHGMNGDHDRGFSNGPGGGNGGYYGPMESSGGQQNPYQPQAQYSLPPRHSSPPPSSPNHPQAGSSSNPNLLPFPPDSDTNLYPPPSPYYPPAQHQRPPDPLYSAQSSLQGSSHPSSLNQQQFPSSRQQQQQPPLQQHQQQQQQLPPQTLIPVTMANSLGLPVGMGGVNPLLAAGGRFPGSFGRLNGTRGLDGLQQGAGGGRGEIEEEISTIFVVGFPDDMQEREFQNMFTFCRDFEAATLKLPPPLPSSGGLSSTTGLPLPSPNPLSPPSNAELNSYYYGPQAHFLDPSAPFDLYHDPTSNPALAGFGLGGIGAGAGGLPGGRRQIIGFAKFRTRQAALEARDALQGRKVDVDRASVLKAEMAKKNLHTRRGVGGDEPLAGGGGGAGGGIGQIIGGSLLSLAASGAGTGAIPGTSALSRGRLDSFGPGGGAGGYPGGDWSNSAGGGGSTSTQQQPFASTSNQPHSRPQSYPYPSQAFESNQGGPSSRPASSLSSSSDPSSPRYAPSSSQTETPLPPYRHQFDSHLQSQPQQRHFPLSPPNHHSYPQSSDPSSRYVREDDILLLSPPPSAALPSSYQQQQQPAPRTRSLSRPQHAQPSRRGFESGLPDASEAAEVFSEGENEMGEGRPGGGFDGSTTGPIVVGGGGGRGATSGEDTGPGSASSSLGRAGGEKASRGLPRTSNPADMNPPINTLYVGNLPTSPPTHPSTHLEDALRALFSRCEGFRRMSFRQKSNGPMCFVEFEDVTTASVALRDLYGDNLGGFVKGGIRLSYSKHPLGQRGPPTTTSSTTSSSTISGVPTAPTSIPGSSSQIHGTSSSTTSSSGGGPSSFSSPPHPALGSPSETTFHSDSSATSSQQPQHHHHHHHHHQHHASLSPPTSFAAGLPLPARSSAVPPRSTGGASAFERHSSPPNPEYLSSSSSHSHFGSSPSSSAMLTQSPASTRGFLSTSVHQDWKGGMGTFSPFGGEVESG